MTTPWIKKNVIEARLVLARDAKQHFAGIEFVMNPGGTHIGVIPVPAALRQFRFFRQSNVKTKIRCFRPVFFDDGAGGFLAMRG